MNEIIHAVITYWPAIAASYSRQEIEEQVTSLLERLRFAAIMAEGRDV